MGRRKKTQRVWFALVDAKNASDELCPQVIDIPLGGDIVDFKRVLIAWSNRRGDSLKGVLRIELWVYANKDAWVADTPLMEDTMIKRFGGSMKNALVVVIRAWGGFQPTKRWNEVNDEVNDHFQWREPTRLCTSAGKDWPYQGADDIAASLVGPLQTQYKAWKDQQPGMRCPALNLVLGGPGTGKSRMLDEIKSVLSKSAQASGDQELITRMSNAFELRVSLDSDTTRFDGLFDKRFLEHDISFRLLYQMREDMNESWDAFAGRWNHLSGLFSIYQVVGILARAQNIDKVEDMTVILSVDGLEKVHENCTMPSALNSLLGSMRHCLNWSSAFVVCVCTATIQAPIHRALGTTSFNHVYLSPPPLRGDEIIATENWMEEQLVKDMGGHGRALEVLQEVLQRHRHSSIEPVTLVNEVMDKLAQAYGSLFNSDLFNDASICQEVLAAVLSSRNLSWPTSFGQPGWTPDKLCSLGLFRYIEFAHSRLECAFVLLVKLLQCLVKKLHEESATFDKHLESAFLLHQPFEDFVATLRRVKSLAFFGSFVPLIQLHHGARFGSGVIGLSIKEQGPRKIVIAKGQPNSSDLSTETNTSMVHDVDTNWMHSIVINTPNAPAGNIVSAISTPFGHTAGRCNEIILCKSTHTNCNMDEEAYNTERQKTDLDDSDIFLLITPGESRDFELPPQCGIVSKAEFQEYFGLFGSRAEHCLEQPPRNND